MFLYIARTNKITFSTYWPHSEQMVLSVVAREYRPVDVVVVLFFTLSKWTNEQWKAFRNGFPRWTALDAWIKTLGRNDIFNDGRERLVIWLILHGKPFFKQFSTRDSVENSTEKSCVGHREFSYFVFIHSQFEAIKSKYLFRLSFSCRWQEYSISNGRNWVCSIKKLRKLWNWIYWAINNSAGEVFLV